MDNFNWVKAAKEVEARAASYASNRDEIGIRSAESEENHAGQFQRVLYPPSVRYMTREGGEPMELVFKIPGILCSKMLPPFRRMPSETSLGRIRNLKQYVKVAAGDSAVLHRAIKNVGLLYDAFKEHVGPAKVHPFSTVPYEGHLSIESHARYFTDRDLVPYEKNEPFLKGVDPNNVLRSIQPESFVHAQDNRVEYCVESKTDCGETLLQPMEPGLFVVGDMVEMVFSFVGIPVKDNMYKVMLHLQGLTLLSSDLRKEINGPSVATDAFNIMDYVVPKRRRLYLTDEKLKNTREEDVLPVQSSKQSSEAQQPVAHASSGSHSGGQAVEEVVEKIILMDVDRK